MKSLPTVSVPAGRVGVPAVIKISCVTVAFVSDIFHVPPEPAKTRSFQDEPFALTVFPLAVEVSRTTPELLRNAPAVVLNDPPTASVPDGSVVVPSAEIVRSFVVVALVFCQIHVPPAPLNVVL